MSLIFEVNGKISYDYLIPVGSAALASFSQINIPASGEMDIRQWFLLLKCVYCVKITSVNTLP